MSAVGTGADVGRACCRAPGVGMTPRRRSPWTLLISTGPRRWWLRRPQCWTRDHGRCRVEPTPRLRRRSVAARNAIDAPDHGVVGGSGDACGELHVRPVGRWRSWVRVTTATVPSPSRAGGRACHNRVRRQHRDRWRQRAWRYRNRQRDPARCEPGEVAPIWLRPSVVTGSV